MNQGRNFPDRGELLREQLRQHVRSQGPISFALFMREALYHPEWGYYASPQSHIGTQGDYFTSVSATRLFGRMLSRCLAKWRDQLGFDGPFAVYEFGAHQGQLRADIEQELPGVEYHALDFADPLPEVMRGCVLSNELLDAMPFHRVQVQGGQWVEQHVGLAADDTFVWQAAPLSDPALAAWLEPLPRHVMEGYTTEVSLQQLHWLRQISQHLSAGYVLSIDYGHDLVEYFAPRRHQGGLRCYYQHQLSDDPLVRVGEQDITADVNFGWLMQVGEEHGLHTLEFTDQSHFLLRHGAELIREIVERDAGQMSRERNALHLLTHPQFLGSPFKVLVQRKGV